MTLSPWGPARPVDVPKSRPRKLEDLLADPMVRLMMSADRFSEAELRHLCEPST